MKWCTAKAMLISLLLLSGCGAAQEPLPSPGVKLLQSQAVVAYQRGNLYMGEGRYLLARQQFSEAADMAVTEVMYNDAVAGMTKAETILQKRRQFHE